MCVFLHFLPTYQSFVEFLIEYFKNLYSIKGSGTRSTAEEKSLSCTMPATACRFQSPKEGEESICASSNKYLDLISKSVPSFSSLISSLMSVAYQALSDSLCLFCMSESPLTSLQTRICLSVYVKTRVLPPKGKQYSSRILQCISPKLKQQAQEMKEREREKKKESEGSKEMQVHLAIMTDLRGCLETAGSFNYLQLTTSRCLLLERRLYKRLE